MLLPILILVVRLTIFTVANVLSLLAFATVVSVLGIINGEFLAIIALPLWAVLPFTITAWIYKRSLKEIDSITLPNWMPGTKYLTWQKQVRQQRSKSGWLQWLTPSVEEGLKAALISVLSVFVVGSLGIQLALFSARPGKAFATFIKSEYGFWVIGFIVVFYALDTILYWNYNQKRWQKIKKQNLTNISSNINDDLSRLKQKVQSQDGYLSQKPKPDKKRRT